ncbi:hypothetical protein HYV10_02380 [Candidatus Dependentiae bacterium]|nr:hypothetical protein [Candidatus Dependentiae bacterium]
MKNKIDILFFSLFITISMIFNQEPTDSANKDSLPFSLQLPINIIELELNHYKDQFTHYWQTNPHAQIIIEEAEILVQTAPDKFQDAIKTQIINLFEKYNLFINFTASNTVIITNNPIKKLELLTPEHRIHTRKHKKHMPTKKSTSIAFKPKRIHGARRTMNRLKKEAREKEKRDRAAIKARIEAEKERLLHTQKEKFLGQENAIQKDIFHEY